MIYRFLRWYASIGIKFFYKNVFIYNETKIEKNVPTIFASNHPAGFYEAIILTSIIPKPIYFLVRSDYVNIPMLKWFFNIIKLLPIYRQSEGLNNVKKNTEVFSGINNSLKKNAFIGIYPEGTTKYQFNLNPIKKGISRIAVGALRAGIPFIKIIPAGFNFSQPDKFRSFLNVFIGSELNVTSDDIKDKKDAVAIRELNSKINAKMHDVNIAITDAERQDIFSKLQIILINNHLKNNRFKTYYKNSSLPKKIKELSRKIENMDSGQFSTLKNDVNQYFSTLEKEKINDFPVIKNKVNILNTISLILGFPLFIAGVILNILPVIPALFIVGKYTKVYEYKAVLKVLISQFLYAFYYAAIVISGFILFGYKGLILIFIPLAAWYSIRYYDLIRDFLNSIKFTRSSRKKEIQTMRNKIINVLNEI